ncbi:Phosphoribosylformylglycinamidine synthase [Serratia odorifera]|uniref:Phosphoribosylformylglycinamidine synthase n=1 Tax=Serratia odorifera TaxID=618 RepID=A0A447KTF5_SEROD|nr:Phosphoribosylformylglycinamidine synthase [Serratia odorifera]
MEILRGSPALSAFRVTKLLSRCQDAQLPVSDIYAEYVHFADVSAPLSAEEHGKLTRLLKYGPSLAEHAPGGTPAVGNAASGHHFPLVIQSHRHCP